MFSPVPSNASINNPSSTGSSSSISSRPGSRAGTPTAMEVINVNGAAYRIIAPEALVSDACQCIHSDLVKPIRPLLLLIILS